ncbi:MAG TPA: DoxX family protein [Candidatus Polarisedimenticolia bacterium]|nr:DoxX family protein [Candidatus Polarisedimenticolia bacterium]
MERWLGNYSAIAYAVMRFVAGLLFACHGAQKLFGALGGQQVSGHPLMTVAGIIEFVGGLLVCIGLWAGCAAFVCSGQMAVAYFMAHAPNGFWPILNHGELAALYCFVFLFIATRGSGRYSVEALLLAWFARRR